MASAVVSDGGVTSLTATPLTLYVDLEAGARIDLEVAAEAALQFSRFIKAVAAHQIGRGDVAVELEGVFSGSHRLVASIRAKGPSTSTIKTAVVAAPLWPLWEGMTGWGVSGIMAWLTGTDAPAEAALLSEEDRRLLAEEVADALRVETGRSEAREVYRALERDPRVTGAGVTAAGDQRPEVVVPRSDFPGLLEAQSSDPSRRVTVHDTELLLIRPVLTDDTDRRWGFQTPFGSFGAPIKDTAFLGRVAAGTPLTQGIRLRVGLEVTEEFQGEVWRTTNRIVLRVLEVIPPPEQRLLGFVEDTQKEKPSDHDDGGEP